ncbi:ROK family protein [uncultured Jatrophihabitans sp.]|uniref:ROK family protein n=1 Tax=uncultured Jatrophihabitans sp. TaxID=1610747 RepID=UPI0035CA50E0
MAVRHPSAARPDTIRRHNLSLMLTHLHHDGALTRAELTQRLGVSRSTVGALVADLTLLGLVEELVPTGGAGVGRPSHVVGPNSRGPIVIAVDVDVTHVTLAAIRLGGSVLLREEVALRDAGNTPQAVAALVAEAVPRLCAGDQHGPVAPVGIGVSVPGTVDRDTGRVGVAPNLGWHDAPLGTLLRERIPQAPPIIVGNDADLAVIAEHHRGSVRDCDDVVFLLGRAGVGAGVIVGGVPLRGHDGHAGEIGHNVVDSRGPRCHCGKNGCIETYIGDGALLALAGHPGEPTDAAVEAVFARARDGEATALASVRAIAEPLGRAIADLVNTLNPQRVVMGGSLALHLEIARPEIEQALGGYALELHGRTVQLVAPALGADSALLGAAEAAFAPLLNDPLATMSALAS